MQKLITILILACGGLMAQSNLKFYSFGYTGVYPNINQELFGIDSSGNNLEHLHTFYNWGKKASNEVIADNNFIYGATSEGGSDKLGTVFKVRLSDNKYEKLFDLDSTFGYRCINRFTVTNNKVFGVCRRGAMYNRGCVFMYDLLQDTCIKLHDFDSLGSNSSYAEMIYNNSDNKIYGITYYGGSFNNGSIFSIDVASGALNFIKDLPNHSIGIVQTAANTIYINSYDIINTSWIYEYDIITNALTLKYSINGDLGPLEYCNGELFGFINQTYPKKLFKYNIASASHVFPYGGSNYSNPVSYGMRLNQNNRLVFVNQNYFVEYDPVTDNFVYDNSIYNIYTDGGNYNDHSLCIGLNNKYYLSSYGNFGFNQNQLGFVKVFDFTNHTIKNTVDFDNTPEGTGFETINPIKINNKLYGLCGGGNINSGVLLSEYDLVTKKRIIKKELYDFSISTFGCVAGSANYITLGSNGNIYGMLSPGSACGGPNFCIFEYNPSTNSIVSKLLVTGQYMPLSLIETAPNVFTYNIPNGIYEYDATANTNTLKNPGTLSVGGVLHGFNNFLSKKSVNGKLYGYCVAVPSGAGSSICEYDIASHTFSNATTLNTIFTSWPHLEVSDFNQLSVTHANNGNVYMMVANENPSYTNAGCLIEYNPNSNTVSLKHTFTNTVSSSGAQCYFFGQSINNKIYAKTSESLYEYDLTTDIVTDKYLNITGFRVGDIWGLHPICQNSISITSQPTPFYSCISTGSLSLSANVNLPGQVSYQWFFNNQAIAGATSSLYLNASANISNSGKYFCSIFNGCDFKKTDTVTVSIGGPALNVSATSTTCIGSSETISVSGAMNYLWNSGSTTSTITVSPTGTTTYSVTGTDIAGCSTTETVSVVVDPTCADVWPGDANSDGLADNIDVLELGLHYTQSGTPRTTISNSWQSYFSNNWAGTITNGKNLNHSDCNGDGTIDDNDTLAIYNNYGLTHTFKPVQTNTVNPQLSIVPDQVAVLKGTWGTASIYLGDATTNINNINGVAFTVDFDNTLIETNNIYIEYQNSFLDAGQNLDFRKSDFANGKIFSATTHTVSSNVSGYGKIATLHYQIKSTLTSAQVLNIGLSQANQSDASGVITSLTSGTGSLTATIDVGLKEFLNSNLISMSPNPTNGSLTINSKTELQKIEVASITGQVLLIETPTTISHTLHLENFANGIYFVNVYQNNRIVKREKIVLSK